MSFSYISQLRCPKCGATYTDMVENHLCCCGSPLLVQYDLDTMKRCVKRQDLNKNYMSLWRYHFLLPVRDSSNIVTLGEGLTPLVPMERLASTYHISSLLMKDEGLIPTGSFKARGAAVGVSKAKELGIQALTMPTNGNAGAAWALYAARANMASYIVMPLDAPEITRREVSAAGAHLFLVDGLISDAGKIVANLVQDYKLYDASTLKEPYRIEGKKTMGLELIEQLNWNVPDVILYPTGGGVGIIGIYKAIQELMTLGWIENSKMPRLVAVQSEGCAPIVQAWNNQSQESVFWQQSETIAFGINVPKAIGDFLVLQALYETEGCAIAVSETDIKSTLHEIAEQEGCFVCPEGAATFAAAKRLREENWIKKGEQVVCLNTGMGLKYPNVIDVNKSILKKDARIKIVHTS
ncbi:threonine synthase [Bacillus sp. HMF5848]|uniref:threonine synthase n=1 Tax=Bacillus sp. HMF5848 TaxID=2495421 RepID=UPI000F7A62D8|nr:threonine synthase [Bacillus sp. HMF5848]RSK29327.1 threonine synthase [Bacillus sp. HMF5848]